MRHAQRLRQIQLDYTITPARRRPCRWYACTASRPPAPRSARPMPSSAPGDGVVQRRKPRCIACNNCVLACPFGVPKMHTGMRLMMKCDMCYDRTSVGKKPMCASVCPSQALYFGTRTEIEPLRPNSQPINTFSFGGPDDHDEGEHVGAEQAPATHLDVVAALHEPRLATVLRTTPCWLAWR